ncbi:MAG: isoleucine--tRNA ligase, partial [Alloprevotella sp.]|nr:isoleucine--tRNA ligase [Alloprevotella sp.]
VEGEMIQKTVKCNFRVMGKKFGKRMKAVAAGVAGLTPEQIATLEGTGTLSLVLGDGDPTPVLIERADVEIVSQDMPGWTVANDGALTVALDLEITDELRLEGMAREIVKRIQTYRKESGFDIVDHIDVRMADGNNDLRRAVEKFHTYICAQVLADSFEFGGDVQGGVLDFDTFKVNVKITKA